MRPSPLQPLQQLIGKERRERERVQAIHDIVCVRGRERESARARARASTSDEGSPDRRREVEEGSVKMRELAVRKCHVYGYI
jgi:hypothetical protein